MPDIKRVVAPSFVALMMPLSAFAFDAPDTDWHRCNTDADCVLIEGICGKAAVNPVFVAPATEYYAARRAESKCSSEFWKKSPNVVRCRLQSCEVIYDPAK